MISCDKNGVGLLEKSDIKLIPTQVVVEVGVELGNTHNLLLGRQNHCQKLAS